MYGEPGIFVIFFTGLYLFSYNEVFYEVLVECFISENIKLIITIRAVKLRLGKA